MKTDDTNEEYCHYSDLPAPTAYNTRKITQIAIDEARDVMERFDPGPGMTIEYEKESYTLTAVQMKKIAMALFLADCEIHDFETTTEK